MYIIIRSSLFLYFLLKTSSGTTQGDYNKVQLNDIRNVPNMLRLQITSSVNQVLIELNSHEVINYTSKDNLLVRDMRNTTNGLHLVIINSRNGKPVLRRYFTTEVFAEDIEIIPLLSTFNQNELVIFAVKFDGSLNLSKDVRNLMQSLGSETAIKLNYRCYFLWAFIKGGKTIVESFISDNPSLEGDFASSPIRTHISIPLDIQGSCWDILKEQKEDKRAAFCSKYGGYGSLCSCESPSDLGFTPTELQGSVIDNVPVLIIASNRPQSLYRCLATVLDQPGGKKSNILVIIDGHYEEVMDLLHMMDVPYRVNSMTGVTFSGFGARISAQFNYALNLTLRAFPTSNFVIVLEEDILVAPDFFSFFNQTANVLASDPSLYCVSAWNDLSALHTGGNPHRVMRLETQPAIGWMVTRTFVEEVTKMWFSLSENFDWDIWFRGPWVRSSRECLVPEVSRSFHMGYSGIHVKGQMTHSHFAGHLITSKENIVLENLDRLTELDYEEDIHKFFEGDRFVYLNMEFHRCNVNLIPKNYTEKTIVIFFEMICSEQHEGWKKIASCFGLFNLDQRDNHHGLFKFYFYGTSIYAIGYPYSHYSYLKPAFITPIPAKFNEWEQKHIGRLIVLNRKRFRVPHLEKYLPHSLLLDEPVGPPAYYYKRINIG